MLSWLILHCACPLHSYLTCFSRVAWLILDCARLICPLYLGEWPRLPFTARIERALSHRARSASKKGTWPLLPIPPCSLVISEGWGLIDLPLRATFSPAHPLARRDVPLARARVFRDRALREHRRSSGSIPFPLLR